MVAYKAEKLQDLTMTLCNYFSLWNIIKDVKVRSHYTGLDRPLGLQEFEVTKI
jgi:hypothetical protein